MQDSEAQVFLTLSFLVVLAGVLVIVLGLRHRLKILEMTHRERLAIIDKGLLPPPDRGPAALFHALGSKGNRPLATDRRLSFGIGMVGWGVGIAALFSFAFQVPGVGLGFGGAFAAVGFAMIVAAMVTRDERSPASSSPPIPVPPPVPPLDLPGQRPPGEHS